MSQKRQLGAVCVLLLLGVAVWGFLHVPRRQAPKVQSSTRFRTYLGTADQRMVVYSPDPDADARTITAALTLLRQNFDSLSLYSCTSQTTTIVEVAQQLHYQAVLLTVWDPRSEAELAIASSLVRDHAKDLILAVSIGSEGLMQKRYTLDDMMAARAELLDRNISSTAVEMTTTEPWWLYMKDDQAALRDFGEFTAINVHVVWDTDLKSPAMAAQWTRDRAEEVRSKVGKSLLLRESGFPGGGHSPREGLELTFTREMQAEFWRAWLLLPQRPASAVFEGVDNPSKHWRGFESEWGLVSADLQPWPAWSVFSTPAASPQR